MNYKFIENKVFFEQWCDMLCKFKDVLTVEDLDVLESFAKKLGTSDTLGELKNIDMHLELISKSICDADADIKQKSKIYKTLGLSLGVTISILLI